MNFFESIFDLPLWICGVGIIGLLCGYAVAGLWVVRRHLLPRLRIRAEDSEFIGAMMQAVMVFYGLAVALIAVSVWQAYSDSSKLVSQEAAAIAALYRDASLYPEPTRAALQTDLRDFVHHVIHEAWPRQRQGKLPVPPAELVKRLTRDIKGFEPASDAQKLLHGETLRALNEAIKATRLRVDATGTGLPGILWVVIAAGAVISLGSAFLFKVEDARLHGIQVVLLAAFIGLVIFMIFALDRPFRGDLGLRPDAYQLIHDQLMKP
jgi:hypothetical protein